MCVKVCMRARVRKCGVCANVLVCECVEVCVCGGVRVCKCAFFCMCASVRVCMCA